MDITGDFNSCQGTREHLLAFANEARTVGADEAAEICEAVAAALQPILDAYPAAVAEHASAQAEYFAAGKREKQVSDAVAAGMARTSELHDARDDRTAAYRRVQLAQQAALSLQSKALDTTKKVGRAMIRAEEWIEGIVNTCINGYGNHWNAADPKKYGDAESAVFEPVYAARALVEYPKLVHEHNPRRSRACTAGEARPIEVLREVLEKRCPGKKLDALMRATTNNKKRAAASTDATPANDRT